MSVITGANSFTYNGQVYYMPDDYVVSPTASFAAIFANAIDEHTFRQRQAEEQQRTEKIERARVLQSELDLLLDDLDMDGNDLRKTGH